MGPLSTDFKNSTNFSSALAIDGNVFASNADSYFCFFGCSKIFVGHFK